MSEYVGSEVFVALQKSLRARQDIFARDPLISNGGRIMNILDPEAYGWDSLRADAERDRFVGLTMVDRDRTLARLDEIFGDSAAFPYWQVFTGQPAAVLPACDRLLAQRPLPAGWRMQSFSHPDDATIQTAQALNMAVGVAATPAYYLRGEVLPSVLTCLYAPDGTMVGCAAASQRYHAQSRLAGWIFAGGVSVHPDHQGQGLGACLNAALLRDSHHLLDWTGVLEQAKADNHASVGMITKCGLTAMDGKVTIVVNLTGGHISR